MKSLLVARLTIKRMLRAHYLLPLLFLALFIMVIYSSQSEFDKYRIAGKIDPLQLLNAGSASLFILMNVFCFFGSIWLALFIVPEELNSGHMRMNLTKPVGEVSVLFGHFLAMFAYLVVGAMFLAFALTVAMWMRGGEPGFLILGYVLHLMPLYGCFLALANVMVLLVNRPMAVFFCYILGVERILQGLIHADPNGSLSAIFRLPLHFIGYVGYAVAPPLSKLEIRISQYMSLDFPWDKYMLVLLYCVSYLILAHAIGAWLLRRKEI